MRKSTNLPYGAHDLQQKIKRFTLRTRQEKQYSREELGFPKAKMETKCWERWLRIKSGYFRGAWVAQSVKVWLRLTSWSQGSGIEPHVGLPAHRGVYLSLFLCSFPCLCSLSNKYNFKKIFFKKWVFKYKNLYYKGKCEQVYESRKGWEIDSD